MRYCFYKARGLIMTLEPLTEAELAADRMDEMAAELHRQAAALRAKYSKPRDPNRVVTFAFPPEKKQKSRLHK